MMTPPRTLRRKLQKKLKRKPHRRCPKCGGRCDVKLYHRRDMAIPTNSRLSGTFMSWDPAVEVEGLEWRLFAVCKSCMTFWELFWSGGGTGRHVPAARPEKPGG
jgi:hypothetical protein